MKMHVVNRRPVNLSKKEIIEKRNTLTFPRLLLYLADALSQLRQACEECVLFLNLLERTCGRAPHNLSAANDLPARNSCLSAGYTSRFQPAVIGNAHLPS